MVAAPRVIAHWASATSCLQRWRSASSNVKRGGREPTPHRPAVARRTASPPKSAPFPHARRSDGSLHAPPDWPPQVPGEIVWTSECRLDQAKRRSNTPTNRPVANGAIYPPSSEVRWVFASLDQTLRVSAPEHGPEGADDKLHLHVRIGEGELGFEEIMDQPALRFGRGLGEFACVDEQHQVLLGPSHLEQVLRQLLE